MADQATLSERLKGRLAVLALWLAGHVPGRNGPGLPAPLCALMKPFASHYRHLIHVNLQLCMPELTPARREQMTAAVLEQTLQGLAELAWVLHHPHQALERVRSVQGLEQVQGALDRSQPVLLLVPHFGCWEVLNFWLARHFPLHTLYNPSGLQAMDELIRSRRAHFGTTLYPATARGAAALVRTLRHRPGLTALLPDQVPQRGAGRFAPFFGVPAYTATFALRLARQLEARVLVACARRVEQGYRVEFHTPDAGLHDQDLDVALTAMNRSIEMLVRSDPLQYMWAYKRFRRRPDQRPNPYRSPL